MLLPHHFGEFAVVHREPEYPAEIVGVESWALSGAYGRELGGVANQHEAAMAALTDIVHEVFEQIVAVEAQVVALPYHGGLVDNKECVGMLVERPRHAHDAAAVGDGLVYLAVDGEGGLAGIGGQHFGCPAGGSQ